jgi:hypothetical protein
VTLRSFKKQGRPAASQYTITDFSDLQPRGYRKRKPFKLSRPLKLGNEVTEIGILHTPGAAVRRTAQIEVSANNGSPLVS